MIGREFYLAWNIEQDIDLSVSSLLAVRFLDVVEPLHQPIEIFFQIFHAKKHASIGSKPKSALISLVHDIAKSDNLGDVDSARIRDVVVGRVEVHHGNRATQSLKQLVLCVAVCRFS